MYHFIKRTHTRKVKICKYSYCELSPKPFIITKFSDPKIFCFSKASSPGLRATQFSAQWVPGPIYPRVKQSGCENDLSPATRAKVNTLPTGWSFN